MTKYQIPSLLFRFEYGIKEVKTRYRTPNDKTKNLGRKKKKQFYWERFLEESKKEERKRNSRSPESLIIITDDGRDLPETLNKDYI